jgi:4-diphosphocytidyl-2-C-methyl-D-erythritol kinase
MAQSVAPTTLRAGCKINLYLEILARREDGYHELRTLFHPLPEPRDTLHVAPAASGAGLRLECDRPGLDGEDNLVARAWRAFAERTGCAPDVSVRLEKRIPLGAGLGGGSSDAAALLGWLNATAAPAAGCAPMADEELTALAATLGADVPFFLLARPAWAGGIGERLRPAAVDLADFTLVLVCPDVHVSTAWAYGRWDELHPGKDAGREPRDVQGQQTFLTSETREDMSPILHGPRLFNSFEAAVFPRYPELRAIKERLLAHGAAGALMSGSGASVFALFRDPEAAREAARAEGRRAAVHCIEQATGV